MGFLAPWFLLGIAAISVPLWLHLLRQLRRKPQPFSSLMFFEKREQTAVRQRRLRYLALLSLRIAVLLLLALAFAEPFFNRTVVSGTRRRLTIIAVDRSFSMRAGKRMEEAKREAESLVDRLQGQDLAQVAAVDSQVENLTSPELDKNALKAAIESVQAGDRASSFGKFARAVRTTQATTGMKLTVHLVSDMQQTSMPADFKDLPVGEQTSLYLHRVGERDAPNVAVENVTAPRHIGAGRTARVLATIKAWGTKQVTPVQASILIDGKEAASKSGSVPAAGQIDLVFENLEIPYGQHRAEVRIEPHDELSEDDRFPFTIERSEPRKVLFLYASNRPHADFYYKSAIDSGTETGFSVQSENTADASGADFSKFAFVVLSDVGELPAKLADALCAYVEKGGAVLIALGENTARTGRIPLSTERFSEQSQKQGAGSLDIHNGATSGLARLENVQFSETAWLSVKPTAQVIARFADNSPMLVEEHAGEGRKLVFASALDISTSDFPLHAAFVPFVAQTARYLAGWEDTPSSVVSGTSVALRQTRQPRANAADVIGPDGKHELPLSEAAKALSFDLVREGFYEVTRADGRHQLLAVHADRRESDLKSIPDDTLNLWSHTGGSTTDRNESPGVQRQTKPWSFWRFLIVAAIIAALAESMFANRYLTRKGGSSERA